eukprot:NODE_3498_length_548_cov_49.519038_g2960_i0.p2 GENE.NODE_3498_length_548_cov_49.519038_g2960_i0~~NODE_3498_length_548_cov_49.519038_g2960_i0.p2  ORF type:complete len:120 (-),score=38.57 NODE_3498_length_548_cov_49.519038_g2960_i0:48-407(-)
MCYIRKSKALRRECTCEWTHFCHWPHTVNNTNTTTPHQQHTSNTPATHQQHNNGHPTAAQQHTDNDNNDSTTQGGGGLARRVFATPFFRVVHTHHEHPPTLPMHSHPPLHMACMHARIA